ncbi:hypothetical protein OIU92_08515 [Escherichia coli]|nr:hypothetical protein [Escherichia coli]
MASTPHPALLSDATLARLIRPTIRISFVGRIGVYAASGTGYLMRRLQRLIRPGFMHYAATTST